MPQHIIAGVETSVATTSFGARAAGRDVVHRARNDSRGGRLLRVIGRGVLSLPPSTWLLVDITILALGVYVAFLVFPPPGELETPHVALWQASAIFAFGLIVVSLVFGLYERETFMSRSRTLTRMLLCASTATIIAYAVIYVIMYATVGRRVTGLAMAIFLVGGSSIRFGAHWLAHELQCGLLVVGSRTLFNSFEAAQANGLLREYRLVGYATLDECGTIEASDPAYVGSIVEQLDHLAALGVTDIVVGDQATRDQRVMEWMVPCLQSGCRVTNEATFYEKATGQILVDQITPSWFLLADLKVHCDKHATFKRLMDLVTATIGLCLSGPMWPLIALAVKLNDGGPVFYYQDRVGQNGRIFRLYKFRTMRTDAENGKSIWCSPNDPRVTRIGRFMRRSRLDELPQFYNVLMGQMSLVGPRPERPDIVQSLCGQIPFYAERHLVKPGITGWAQISYRYGSSVEDSKRKLQFDLYYLKQMSLELDLIILFRTAGTFLRGGC